MLVELAIADAYGAGREFASDTFTRAGNDGITYVQHPTHSGIKPGDYTDDTQMTIAVALLLLDGFPHSATHLTSTFLSIFKSDPREGYSKYFYDFLRDCTKRDTLTKEGVVRFLEQIVPNSKKSGGAMRAAPCGFLSKPQEVINTAMWQASITHATQEGMNSAAAAALMVWACRHGCDTGYLPTFLTEWLPVRGNLWEKPWTGAVSTSGMEAVRAALAALMDNDSLTAILRQCIDYTGDVDTVAAISVAAASVHPGIKNDFDPWLYNNLENGLFGKDYLISLDKELLDKFPM